MIITSPVGQNITLTATYLHPENILIQRYKFILYDSQDIVLQDSGWIYLQIISYQVDGLLNDSTYKTECIVVDQNELQSTTGKIQFTTHYVMPQNIDKLLITPLDRYGAIQLSWSDIKQIFGYADGSYSFVTGKFNSGVSLDRGTTLRYNQTIPKDFSAIYFCKLPSYFQGDFIRIGSDLAVGYDGQRFYFRNQYRLTSGEIRTISSDFFLIGIKSDKPNKVIIKTDTYQEIL
jgi:hypothetical protein